MLECCCKVLVHDNAITSTPHAITISAVPSDSSQYITADMGSLLDHQLISLVADVLQWHHREYLRVGSGYPTVAVAVRDLLTQSPLAPR